MSKREKIRFIKRLWRYLADQTADAFRAKNEVDFDWYNNAQEVLWLALTEQPIKITPRVKPL